MNPERWRKIKDLFHDTLERPPEERTAFLDQACSGDEQLRAQVEQMLAADARENLIVDKPAIEGVAQLFEPEESEAIAGRMFGHYRVEGEIGRGGMGRVYLAHDLRLQRPVALKLLSETFSNSPERVRRFQQEARAVSALNHPYIMTIHELGETDGLRFIVAEFIDGRTLREIMATGKPELGLVLKIIIQVTDALAVAHRAGIVHRDIKPENIMVRRDGYVKVLDFGLAKLSEEAGLVGDSPAASFSHVTTTPGLVLGTVNYMSPEQARGYVVDARTDIFSLGVVLYEAVSGRAPFQGRTRPDVLIAIAGEQPAPVVSCKSAESTRLQEIIDRALCKKRDERYQTIEEFGRDLEELRDSLSTRQQPQTALNTGSDTRSISASPTSRTEFFRSEIKRSRARIAVLAFAVLVLVTGLSLTLYKLTKPSAHKSSLSPSDFHFTKIETTARAGGAISPDGKYFLIVDQNGALTVRHTVTGSTAQVLAPQPAFANYNCQFTPDSSYLYCWLLERANLNNSFFQRIPLLPGPAQKIADRVASSAAFSADGKRMAFVRSDEATLGHDLVITDADGHNQQLLVRHNDHEFLFRSVAWSPNGEVLAVIGMYKNTDCHECYRIFGYRADNGAEVEISTQRWQNVRTLSWLPDGTGFLLSAVDRPGNNERLWLISYPGGEAQGLTNELSSFEGVSITADGGRIVTSQAERPSDIWLASLDEPAWERKLTSVNGPYGPLTFTPDRHIVYVLGKDLWLSNADGSEPRQLTFGQGSNTQPAVTPDGRYVVFVSTRTETQNIWRIELASGELTQLTNGVSDKTPTCTANGEWVLYQSLGHEKATIKKIPLAGGTPAQIGETNIDHGYLATSPDSKLLAYQYRDVRTQKEYIAIRPVDGGPNQIVMEAHGNNDIHWSRDGKELLYTEGADVWKQPVAGGAPKRLTNFADQYAFFLDVSPDGKTLAVTRSVFIRDMVMITVK
jgi:serine/threonine protein kinase/Tol biopolymer transport system component